VGLPSAAFCKASLAMPPLKKLLHDGSWADRRTSAPWLIGLATFGILSLELALIRWTSSQVRVFAYFNNVVLICAFLGMGLGVALGRRSPGLVHFVLPALLVLALPLAFSEQLNLVHLKFPDPSIMLWGGERMAGGWVFARSLAVFIALLAAVVAVFVCAGAPLGLLFGRMAALGAYNADLVGSLVGVAAFTAMSWLNAGPALWLLLGCLPFVWLARSLVAWLATAAIVALGHFSVQGALFSPYNRIVVTALPDQILEVQVNRDFHQYMFDLSSRRLAEPALENSRKAMLDLQALYDLPFKMNTRRETAVVVGAGTGNDVQAALRNGYRRVTSVDIDGRIIALGRARHPERPYSNEGVTTVVDDARSFFGKNRDEKYDVVCFGLLDSHAMSSAMSTLRLDNYVYTEEGIRAAWERVAPGGHLSLAISVIAGRWFFDRLYWTITRATGREPLAFYSPLHVGTATYIVPREDAALIAAELAARESILPSQGVDGVLTTSDDWPFLYLRPGVVPWGYIAVIAFILSLAAISVRKVFDFGPGGRGFHVPLFLMGAAFLLIETRGVTSLSLLFGSTWVVNSAVFAGILVMVILANLAVRRWQWTNSSPWFVLLFLSVLGLYLLPVEWLSTLPLAVRAVVGGLLTGLPVGLAGVIVPMLLARAEDPAAALGANLLGAVLGGCLEYFSMLGGLRSTALLALVLYLLAFLAVGRAKTAAAA
jgi:hypothetical protein